MLSLQNKVKTPRKCDSRNRVEVSPQSSGHTSPSKMYAFDAKYSPMGTVTMRMVKNSRVLRAETRELSFLQRSTSSWVSRDQTTQRRGLWHADYGCGYVPWWKLHLCSRIVPHKRYVSMAMNGTAELGFSGHWVYKLAVSLASSLYYFLTLWNTAAVGRRRPEMLS